MRPGLGVFRRSGDGTGAVSRRSGGVPSEGDATGEGISRRDRDGCRGPGKFFPGKILGKFQDISGNFFLISGNVPASFF